MSRLLGTCAVVLAFVTVGLFVACIWTAGMQHGSFTLSDKLGATAVVTFFVAAFLGAMTDIVRR